MNKATVIAILACSLLAACNNDRSLEATVTAIDGRDGVDGADGRDGVDGADGRDGVDGAPGVDAIASTTDLNLSNSSTCASIPGTTWKAERDGTNIKIYSGGSCSGSSVVLTEGESYMPTTKVVVFWIPNGLRVIQFN